MFFSSYSAANHHPYLYLFFLSSMLFSCGIPSVTDSPSFSLSPSLLPPSIPLIPCRVYGFMMHGNLTANTFICIFCIFFFLSFFPCLAQQGSELCIDSYRIFTFDLCIQDRVKCLDRRGQNRTELSNEMQSRKEERRAEDDTEQVLQIQSTTPQIKANAEQSRIKMKSM